MIDGADIFLGLSAAGVLKPEMVEKMAARPLILALANPTPEIMPEQVKAVRSDAVIATGRSDYVNQVNNVLCFPFIFRGALDVGATTITTAMETAAVRALAGLAREEQSDIVASAYGVADVSFGPEYLIPKPFDPRLITRIAPAVAQAAMASGVATRPIDDIQAYRDQLQQFVYHSGTFMKPIFAIAKKAHRGWRQVAHRVCRRRRGTRAARGAGGDRRETREAHFDRTASGHRQASRALRVAHATRAWTSIWSIRSSTNDIAATGKRITASLRAKE